MLGIQIPSLVIRWLPMAGMLLCLTPAGVAGPADPYEQTRLIRVSPETAKQTLAVNQIGLSLAGEAIRADGRADYFAGPDAVETLRRIGIPFEVLEADVAGVVRAEQARLDRRRRFEGADLRRPGGQPLGVDFYGEFRDADELIALFDTLLDARPELISSEVVGSSVEGRDIVAYRINAPDGAAGKPTFAFNGTIHAREWISPMTMAFLMDRFVLGYGSDPEITSLLDRVNLAVIPILNPDGFRYSWTSDRFWRKNRRNNGGGVFGVDLNRNFPAGWGTQGSSGNPSSDIYRGPSPLSEPESRALRDLIAGDGSIVAHIDYHSYSQLVLFPTGYIGAPPVPEPDDLNMTDLAFEMAGAIRETTGEVYIAQQSIDLYPAGGVTSDWAYEDADIYSWTIELRPSSSGGGGFAPPPSEIRPTVEENLEALKVLLKRIADGVVTDLPQGPIEAVLPKDDAAIEVMVREAFGATLNPAATVLMSRIDSAGFVASPLTQTGAYTFEGTLPPALCGSDVEYYVQGETMSGRGFAFPSAIDGTPEPITASAAERELAFEDDMESDRGWSVGAPGDTATTGVWNRVDPQPTDAQPGNDHTPAGTLCWVTDGFSGGSLGARDVDDGATTLTSPPLDVTGGSGGFDDALITYWLWHETLNTGGEDLLAVEVSGNGGASWTRVEEPGVTGGAWQRRSFRVAEFVEATSEVRVRFIAADFAPGSIVEAAVDDVRVESAGCYNPADIAEPRGVLDGADVSAFVSAFGAGSPAADIAYPIGVQDGADVSAFITSFSAGGHP